MKLTYEIPQNKEDITLETYLKVKRLYKIADENETEVNEKEIVATCLGIKLEDVYRLPAKEYAFAYSNINEALNSEVEFKLRFNYKGIEFGFIPDLENITAGEFSALDEFLKDADKNAYHIINVLYRPITTEKTYKNWWNKKETKKYLIEPYNSDVEVSFYKDLPYSVYESSLVFFYNLGNDLQNATLKFIQDKRTTKANDLGKNGDGIKRLTLIAKQQTFLLTRYTKKMRVRYS